MNYSPATPRGPDVVVGEHCTDSLRPRRDIAFLYEISGLAVFDRKGETS